MKENKDKKLNEELKEENLKPMYHEGHKPKSRRDFMAQGLLGMTAFALAPSALELLVGAAHAQTTGCAIPATNSLAPVIIIDLAGGGNIAGSNVIVGGAGGQMDFLPESSYASLGLPSEFAPSRTGMTSNELGLMFHSDSGMLRGIRSTTDTGTRANTDGAVFCTTSDDDTGNNQSNPLYWLNRAGAKGSLKQLAGTNQTDSGGNSAVPITSLNPAIAPVRIASNQDAINLVSLGNRFNQYSQAQRDALINTAGKLSKNKLGMIDRRSLPDKIKALIACGFTETANEINKFTETAVNPALDTVANTVFGRITNQGIRNRALPIVKLALDGYIGAGTITLGGYDYHDGTRVNGDNKDFELGQLIGAIMELAARKGTDVVVYVLTDGGVSGPATTDSTGKFIWTGDSGQRSATFMMVYKRDGKPFLRQSNKRQIGYYKTNGAVEGSALLTSNSVVNTSKAMVANYLALHGQEGRLAEVIGDDPFRSDLDKYLVFDKLR